MTVKYSQTIKSVFAHSQLPTEQTGFAMSRYQCYVQAQRMYVCTYETDIIICGDSIVTRSKSRRQQTVEQKPRSSSPESQSH